jgi:hypothetical protein
MRDALTAKPATQSLFRLNSGVFPFMSDLHTLSGRLDHNANGLNSFFLRYSFTNGSEDNQSSRALVALSRSNNVDILDSNVAGNWVHIFGPGYNQ